MVLCSSTFKQSRVVQERERSDRHETFSCEISAAKRSRKADIHHIQKGFRCLPHKEAEGQTSMLNLGQSQEADRHVLFQVSGTTCDVRRREAQEGRHSSKRMRLHEVGHRKERRGADIDLPIPVFGCPSQKEAERQTDRHPWCEVAFSAAEFGAGKRVRQTFVIVSVLSTKRRECGG